MHAADNPLPTWKERPVDSMSTNTNWKYWSMDHKLSTAPSAYDTKKLSAAGVRISYENTSLYASQEHIDTVLRLMTVVMLHQVVPRWFSLAAV